MDIGENITDSIKYPIQDLFKILILTVISIIPIVNFICGGYFIRIIKSTLADVDEVPEFDDLLELFIDGIKMIIIYLIYMIVPLILFIAGFVFLLPAADASYYSEVSMFTGVSFVLFFIAAVLMLLISIIACMGIANMAYFDSEIGAAFRFGEIMDRISAIGWGSYILWFIALILVSGVISFVANAIGGILTFLLVGFLIIYVGLAYLVMFQARSVALTFKASLE